MRRTVEVVGVDVPGRLSAPGTALVGLDSAEEGRPVLDVVSKADVAGAATMTVSGAPFDPAIVIVYGVAPGDNVDDLVAKR